MPQSSGGGSSGLKTASGGYFLIPTGPAVGTTVAQSISANTYGSWVEMIASTEAAIYVVGISLKPDGQAGDTYYQVDVGTGAAAAETSVGEAKFSGLSTVVGYTPYEFMFPFPIPVATATRIACRTASNNAAANSHRVSLICINQADLVSM